MYNCLLIHILDMTTPTSTLDKFDTDMVDVEDLKNEDEQTQAQEDDLEKGIIGTLDSPKVI